MFTRKISLFLIFTMVLMIGGLTQSFAFKAPDENPANNSVQNGNVDNNINQSPFTPELTAPINPGAPLSQGAVTSQDCNPDCKLKCKLKHKLNCKPNLSVQGDEVGAAIGAVDKLMQDAGKEACFVLEKISSDSLTYRHIRLAQYCNGLPVVGCKINVHINSRNEIYQIGGDYLPDIKVNTTPKIKAEKALKIGLKELKDKHGLHVSKEPSLVIYGRHLAYHYVISHEGPDAGAGWYYVDAHSGKLLSRYNNIQHAAPTPGNGVDATVSGNRLAGEDGTSINMTGWKENGSNFYQYNFSNLWGIYDEDVFDWEQNAANDWLSSDPAAVSAGKNFELTQDWVMNVLGRNSFNDAGAFARGNVHVGTNYVNAYWLPSAQQFFFGDGNGIIANALTVQDIVAHEYGHAVTEHTSGLIYRYESGALNESFSDILGAIVEFASQPDGTGVYPGATPGYSDWLMGEDCWLPNPGDALRNLREPNLGSPPQPSYYKGTNWYYGAGDNGGVHYNSGVQNFAFYLLAEGGSGTNDGHPYGPITGLGVVAAGEVAMRANTVYLTPSSQYIDSRAAWVSAATDLGYPAATVEQVWDAVGVGVTPPPPVPPKKDLMVVRELTASPGTYELEVFDIPTVINGDIGLPIASDNDIGTDIQDIAAVKGIGDSLMLTRLDTVTGLYNLQIYKLPDGPGGDINLPIATDDDIGTDVYFVSGGDFDSDPDDETAVVRLSADGITYELEIFDIPTITGGDTGLPVASDLDLGQNIQAIAAANFDTDKEEELAVVRLSTDGVTYELEIFDVPAIVGGDTGLAIASDLDLGNDILMSGLAAGNFDDDAESEIAVARLNVGGVSSRLEIYDAPTTPGGNTGLPVASDNDIGTNIHAIATGIYLPATMVEDFDDGVADFWLDDGSGKWSVQMVTANDGEYVMGTGTGIGHFRYSAYDTQVYVDFTYQVDVSRVSNISTPNNGIMFRSDGTKNNTYLFGISASAGPQFMFGYYLNDFWNWITYWTPSTAINGGPGAWNTLKVVCSGSSIDMYVNDTLVNSVTDTTFSSGKVGVMPADVYFGDEVHYDNALVLSATTCNLPVAGFAGSPTSGNAPLTVNFTDQSTNNPTGWIWDFGDGGTSTLQNPDHTYTTAGTYTVTLTATNVCGSNQAVQVGYITVCNPPVAGFAGNPTTGDAPLTVGFTDQSTNVPTSWSWDFGDGGTSTLQNPNYTYTIAGTYSVSLTATNACGADQAVQVGYITVTQPDIQNPTIIITSPPQESEVSGIVTITVDASDNVGVVRVVYSIDESTILGESTTAPHSYDWDTTTWANGEHKIIATAYDLVGNNEKDEAQVLVTQPPCNPPVAGFAGNPTIGNAPLTVSFADQSTNVPTSWSWDFGDGSTSTLQNPGHTYTTAGTYTVTLTATNTCGSNQAVQVGYITVTQPPCDIPVAGFAGSPTTGDAPLTVGFTDQSTNVPTSWIWDFGDGGTSTLQNPGHTYTTAGTYSVTLTATNACGSNQAVQVGYITVTQPPCDLPVAGFAGSPTTGYTPLSVSFTDQTINTPTGWSWDFGDGVTSTEQNPTHIYSTPGTYTVSLTATNACGTDQVVQAGYITVNQPTCTDPPVADFTGSPLSGFPPLTVSFTDLSTNGSTGWSWDFGDDGSSTAQNPVHTYNEPGAYKVIFTATNPCGSDEMLKEDYVIVMEQQ